VLTDKPISASSAAACTAVPTISVRPLFSWGRAGAFLAGVPCGCGGWRSRGESPREREAAVFRDEAGFALRVGVGFDCWADALAGRLAALDACARSSPPCSGVTRAVRFSLRRCGRLRGSEPSTCEGLSSLIG
jgi:hypothetical protein